ncbi:hypothetical protein [Mesobacillus subterraneus]|uniref:Uncharacterized protein n=1 Tax=Mesobacillus subterraneus TaxID=285983 RepID=A0A427TW85_9BACI|nr:hypothetical protein [Mesobacillus subterraneus]RSD28723.1 hypothetical protein EJA10_03875 [Mesobacillus subterraneus]
MKEYTIQNMIIDVESYDEEHVTVEFTYEDDQYIITFQKSDLELMNAWILQDGSSLPANLPHNVIDGLREDIKKKI